MQKYTTTTTATTTNLRVVRGSYQHASDDNSRRWYLQDDTSPVDRQGKGYRTRRLALDALAAIEAGLDWRAMPMD